MTRRFPLRAGALYLALLCAACAPADKAPAAFAPPDGAIVTYFRQPRPETALPLVISSTVEAGFMQPFLLAFQRRHPTIAIAYIQSRGGAFLGNALATCRQGGEAADIYLSASTDHLVRLANESCARALPASISAAAPGRAAWRNEVFAFTVEPAAFVFGRRIAEEGAPPADHIALLEWLRRRPEGEDQVGTYDIETSADGYNFAASDSRQVALYGRLLEGLGRSDVRLYCCSNVMVDAVDRGEILFAYNVQLSHAYAAQRAGSRISVVLPDDYQALQTLSMMVPKGARSPALATELAAFLVSEEARALARKDLAAPGEPPALAAARADQLLAQASVTPLLLSLQDSARRRHLIGGWREAIRPSPAAQAARDNSDK